MGPHMRFCRCVPLQTAIVFSLQKQSLYKKFVAMRWWKWLLGFFGWNQLYFIKGKSLPIAHKTQILLYFFFKKKNRWLIRQIALKTNGNASTSNAFQKNISAMITMIVWIILMKRLVVLFQCLAIRFGVWMGIAFLMSGGVMEMTIVMIWATKTVAVSKTIYFYSNVFYLLLVFKVWEKIDIIKYIWNFLTQGVKWFTFKII